MKGAEYFRLSPGQQNTGGDEREAIGLIIFVIIYFFSKVVLNMKNTWVSWCMKDFFAVMCVKGKL